MTCIIFFESLISALVFFHAYVEILREDRLWLRNQLKEGNQDLMRIFLSNSEATSPLPKIDIRTLQINLRKYIAMIKQKNKAEQLVKFK
jgi:hypothetical protein